MPLRNFRCLIALTVLSVLCYFSAPRTQYSRVLADNLDCVARQYYRPVSETGAPLGLRVIPAQGRRQGAHA